MSASATGLGPLRAPALEDVEALADAAFARLPAPFRRLCEGLVIQVADFADDDTLDEMGIESEFDLLGLFRGRGLPDRGATGETGQMPNMIWLYRRPLLDAWCDGEDTLEAVVTHVLVHEIGHHFGLSDDDMEAIERDAGWRFAARPRKGLKSTVFDAFTRASRSLYSRETVGCGPAS